MRLTTETLCMLGSLAVAGSVHAQTCDAPAVAGTYASAYGEIVCSPTGEGLDCCYGAQCANRLELTFASDRSMLAGNWSYPNGLRGPAEFDLGADCALTGGRWGRGSGQATATWSIRGRTSPAASTGSNDPVGGAVLATGQVLPEARLGRGDISVRGRYSCNIGEIGVELALDFTGERSVEGTFWIIGLDPIVVPGAARGITTASYRVTGSFDPFTGGMDLRAGDWIGAPGRLTPSGVQGVYLAEEGILLGQLMQGASPHPQCTALIASRDDGGYRIPPTSDVPLEDWTGPPSCVTLGAWAGRLTREYPEMDIPQTEVPILEQRAAPLFYDDAFAGAFGTNFHQVSADLGRPVVAKIMECKRDPSLFNVLLGVSYQSFAVPTGIYGRGATEARVWRSRALAIWRRQMVSRLGELPPSRQSFAQARDVGDRANTMLFLEWPSVRTEFDEAVSDALATIAEQVIPEELDALERSEPTLATATAVLELFEGRALDGGRAARGGVVNGGLMGALSEDTRRTLSERGRRVLEAILEATTRADASAIDSFPDGIEGLEASRAWWLNMANRYEPFGSAPPIEAMRTRLLERRAVLMESAEPQIVAQFESTSSYEGLQGILGRSFLFDAERASSAGQRLVVAAEARRFAIDREAYLAMFSERERSLMDGNDRLTVPRSPKAPSGEEIRLATLREISGLWGTRTSPTAVAIGTGPFSAFIRYDLTVRDATSVTCDPNGGTFRCRYTVRATLALAGSVADEVGTDLRAGFMQFLVAAMNSSPPAVLTDQFVMTESGWRSPTIRARYAGGLLAGISAMAEGMSRGLAGEACLASGMAGEWDPGCE